MSHFSYSQQTELCGRRVQITLTNKTLAVCGPNECYRAQTQRASGCPPWEGVRALFLSHCSVFFSVSLYVCILLWNYFQIVFCSGGPLTMIFVFAWCPKNRNGTLMGTANQEQGHQWDPELFQMLIPRLS